MDHLAAFDYSRIRPLGSRALALHTSGNDGIDVAASTKIAMLVVSMPGIRTLWFWYGTVLGARRLSAASRKFRRCEFRYVNFSTPPFAPTIPATSVVYSDRLNKSYTCLITPCSQWRSFPTTGKAGRSSTPKNRCLGRQKYNSQLVLRYGELNPGLPGSQGYC